MERHASVHASDGGAVDTDIVAKSDVDTARDGGVARREDEAREGAMHADVEHFATTRDARTLMVSRGEM
jgi:hypothetical protein|tara:strand:+ start:5173 stop:5379 length:207 start_codon:yes stop_codon:yes gene_type:complete